MCLIWTAMKRQQRNNIAARADGAEFEYLKDEVARRLIDRLEDVDREFPFALDLGCGSGHIYKQLRDEEGLGGIKELIQCDSAGVLSHLHRANKGCCWLARYLN